MRPVLRSGDGGVAKSLAWSSIERALSGAKQRLHSSHALAKIRKNQGESMVISTRATGTGLVRRAQLKAATATVSLGKEPQEPLRQHFPPFYVRHISAERKHCCIRFAEICCAPSIAYEATRSRARAGKNLSCTSYLHTSPIHFRLPGTTAPADHDKL